MNRDVPFQFSSAPEMCPARDGDDRPCIYPRGHRGHCGFDWAWKRFWNEDPK